MKIYLVRISSLSTHFLEKKQVFYTIRGLKNKKKSSDFSILRTFFIVSHYLADLYKCEKKVKIILVVHKVYIFVNYDNYSLL
jgi:hypothetical protein